MLLLILIIAIVILFVSRKQVSMNSLVEPVVVAPALDKEISLCFYSEKATSNSLKDISALELTLQGDKVTAGYLSLLPAEKDRKTGPLTGTVGPVDKIAMARKADLWWQSSAEGMNTSEQLFVTFGDGTAYVGFGEMVDRGDGAYVYRNPASVTYGPGMTDIACSDLQDKMLVDDYIRKNITTLTPNKPVLGGTWYVLSTTVNPVTHTGSVVYEDGHIQVRSNFTYTRKGTTVSVVMQKVGK